MSNITRLLSECMRDIPIDAELTPRQKDAARMLKNIVKKGFACHREFYEHVIEERRRRQEDKEIHMRMRGRETAKRAKKTE